MYRLCLDCIIHVLTLYLLVFIISMLILKYGRQYLNFRSAMDQLPGDDDFHPILGNIHTFPGFNDAGLAWTYERVKKYKYFFRIYVTPFLASIFVYHPDTVKEVISSNSIKPRRLSPFLSSSYDMGVGWLGDGLITTNGHRWYRNRRLLTPSFHFDILKNYMNIYNDCSVHLLDNVSVSSKTGKSIDFQAVVGKYTLDVILRCAFSYKSNCQTDQQPGKYATAIAELQSMWMKRLITPVHYVDFIYKLTSEGRRFYSLCDVAHREAETIMKRRKSELESNPGLAGTRKVRDFLDTLLTARDEEGEGLSWTEIREEVDTFLFAGHDTTASAIMWTLVSLAQHPEHQDRVYAEVKAVFEGGEGQGQSEVRWEDLSRLQYTGQCIKEALRLHSAVPGTERVTTEDVVFNGHRIKKGTVVILHLWSLHHNPHVWENPHDFQPERFHPDNVVKMDPFQFIPFSAGSRNCIGQNFAMNEMKVAVAKVVNRFHLKADVTKPARHEMSITMKTSHGAYLFATER